MKKASKIILIIALCFLVLGIGLYAAAVGMTGKLGLSYAQMQDTIHSESKSETIREPFQSIRINDVECDIRLVPAEGSDTVVEYADCNLYQHEIRVKDGTLIITAEDVSNFWDRFFVISRSHEIIIHLPFSQLEELGIETVSGDIQVPSDFSIGFLSIGTTSGNVEIACPVSGSVTIETVSGSITLEHTAPNELFLEATSGEVNLTAVTAGEFAELSTVSGNIQLNGVEAPSLLASTVSGNLTGTTPTVKSFQTDTTSGSVYLSDHQSDAPVWELTTVSGDIRMTVAP